MDDIMKTAVGRWPGILAHFGVPERALSGKHGPCPMCEGKDRFRMIKLDGDAAWVCNQCGGGDGMDLLMAFLNMPFAEAAKKAKSIVSTAPYVQPKRITGDERKRLLNNNVDLWKKGEKDSPLLFEYMRGRGLKADEVSGADLRIVPSLALYDEDGKVTGNFPCMVSRVSSRDGKLASIHRTYLIKQDEGNYKTEKKLTAVNREWEGGCIRLMGTKDETRLIVAEGIETALSVRARIKRLHDDVIPCWATVSANGMEKIAIPDHIKTVMVAADNDTSFTGQKAAFILANRLKVHDKRNVIVVIPGKQGSDFNDELIEMTHGKV